MFIKENNLQDVSAQVLHTFPEARFIFQVRDPRDFLASAKKLKGSLLRNKFGSVYNAINIWHDDQEYGVNMLSFYGPDRVFFQRYEDLVKDPRSVIKEMCSFLNVPHEESMLEFYKAEQNIAFASSGKQWENISQPVINSNSGGLPKGIVYTVSYLKEFFSSEVAYCRKIFGQLCAHWD